MKRIISVLTVLLMITVLFCSCKKQEIPDETSSSSESTTEAPVVKFERGETSGTKYTNESIKLSFTLADGWRFYTDQEIAAMLNITVDMFKDKDIFKSSDLVSLIDFMALDPVSGNNVNLSVENLKTDISVSEYADAFKKLLAQQLPGATYSFGETKEIKLGENTFLKLPATCSYSGVNMNQYVYLLKIENYMISISATSVNGADASVFEAMFT